MFAIELLNFCVTELLEIGHFWTLKLYTHDEQNYLK